MSSMLSHLTPYMESWRQHFYFTIMFLYLTIIGFKIKPNEPCVANKMTNSKQMTMVWHVDDIKVSHYSKKIVTGMEKMDKENLWENFLRMYQARSKII